MTINVTPSKLYKLVQLVLLIIIVGLLLWSKPWDTTSTSVTRKITVTGEATISATPDEYVFTPYFQATGTDRDALKSELTAKANSAVEKLKELGVQEDEIRLDASSYDYWYAREGEEGQLQISLQITVNDQDKTQEIQDYLLSIDVEGQLTPQASFSKDKQKELDVQAIEEASADAKAQAERQVSLLGAKLGKVLEVSQSSGFGYPIAYDERALDISASVEGPASLPVLPGQNDYAQSVTVTYELR